MWYCQLNAVQSVVHPSMIISAGTLMSAPLMFHVFTVTLPWGLPGAAIASVATTVIDLVGLTIWSAVYVQRMPRASSKRQVWSGLSMDAFKQWGTFFELGLPSMAMLCLEWCVISLPSWQYLMVRMRVELVCLDTESLPSGGRSKSVLWLLGSCQILKPV